MSDILLAAMPFVSLKWPSAGLGQLVAAAKKAGLDAAATYASLRFAADIGSQMYYLLANIIGAELLIAEWIFSLAAFQDFGMSEANHLFLEHLQEEPDFIRYFEKYIAPGYGGELSAFVEECDEIREKAKKFIDRTAEQIVAKRPAIVGCGTSWMQYTSALALLRQVKRLNPAIITMLGGENCEAEVGVMTQKTFPWIDVVVSGEADSLFPHLCQQLLEHGLHLDAEDIPYGVYCQQKLAVEDAVPDNALAETAIEKNLDEVPIPDYSDYFKDLNTMGLTAHIKPHLVMETSRGCWKGQKQPCTFCSLNGKRMLYRTKSLGRVLYELDYLSKTYDIQEFLIADTILNMEFFHGFFSELAKNKKSYTFIFETSSMLQQHHIKAMAEAGVCVINPGIESVHDALLALLEKGNSAIHNVGLLKYCREEGVQVVWNLLCGIPGDCEQYYHEMAEILPLMYHLDPPTFGTIRFDRFSVYHQKPEQFGLELRPLKSYRAVYPFGPGELENFASFFETSTHAEQIKMKTPGIVKIEKMVAEWRTLHYTERAKPTLTLSETAGEIKIVDTRPCALSPEFSLTGIERCIYKGCRTPASKEQLSQLLSSDPILENDGQGLEQGLRALLEKRLLFHVNGKYLALANEQPRKEVPQIYSSVQCKPFKKRELKLIKTSSGFQFIRI